MCSRSGWLDTFSITTYERQGCDNPGTWWLELQLRVQRVQVCRLRRALAAQWDAPVAHLVALRRQAHVQLRRQLTCLRPLADGRLWQKK